MRLCAAILALALLTTNAFARAGNEAEQKLREQTESALATLRPSVAQAELRWRGEFVGTLKTRAGQSVPEPEIMAEIRRANQALETGPRIAALWTDLERGSIDKHKLGDALDEIFCEAVIATWDIQLTEARRMLELSQARIDEAAATTRTEWSALVDQISKREGLTAAQRQQELTAAAAPFEATERQQRSRIEQELDAVARALVDGRTQLTNLLSNRAEAARAAKRLHAPERLTAVIEAQLESAGPDAPAASSFDTYVASAELRIPAVVLRGETSHLTLAARVSPLLANRLDSNAGPLQLVPPKEPSAEIIGIAVLRSPADFPFLTIGNQWAPGDASKDRWTLFVLGRDLMGHGDQPTAPGLTFTMKPSGPDGALRLIPDVRGDAQVSYVVARAAAGLTEMRDDALLREGFERTCFGIDIDNPAELQHLDGLVIVASVAPHVAPDFRRLSIGPARAEWMLAPGTARGTMRFVRILNEMRGEVDELHEAFLPDHATIELAVEQELPVDEIRVAVYCNGNEQDFNGQSTLVARRLANSRTVYRTDPILLHSGSFAHPDQANGRIGLPVAAGDTLVAIPVDGYFQVAPSARVAIHATPATVRFSDHHSALWKDALREAAKLWDKDVSTWDTLAQAEVDSVTNVYVFQLDWHTTRFTMADHAAMLLLRRQFITMANEQKQEFTTILADDALTWGYYRSLQPLMDEAIAGHANGVMLCEFQVDGPGGPGDAKVPFKRAFDIEYLRQKFRSAVGPTQAVWQKSVTQQAIRQQLAHVDRAIARATAIDAKDIAGLVDLTGDSFEPVLERLRPLMLRLVDVKDSSGTPVSARWEPEPAARAALLQIRNTMAELATARKGARADTDALLAVLSVAALNPAGLMSKAILAGVSVASVGQAAADVVALSGYEAEVDFARGAAPILGSDRLDAAKARAENPQWLPYATLFASVLGLHFDIADLAKGIRLSAAYQTGGRIAQTLNRTGVAGLRRASEHEVRAFLVAAEDSRLAQQTGMKLTEAQSEILKTADKLDSELTAAVEMEAADLSQPAHWFAATDIHAPPDAAASAKSASEITADLEGSGLDGVAALNQEHRELLERAYREAQAARAAGKELTLEQSRVLKLNDQVADEARSRGITDDPFRAATHIEAPPAAAVPTGNPNAPGPKPGFPVAGQAFLLPGMSKPVRLGKFRGGGAFCHVYDLADEPGWVIKFVKRPEENTASLTEILDRMDRSARLIAEHPEIPQVAMQKPQQFGEWGIVKQRAIPDGAVLYARDHPKVAQMYDAALRFHALMRKSGIAWWDSHMKNLYFMQGPGDTMVAGILDADMCLRATDEFGDIYMAHRITTIEQFGGVFKVLGQRTIRSLPASHLDEAAMAATALAAKTTDRMTWTVEESAVRMLEFNGFIYYDRAARQFVDGKASVQRVIDNFGDPMRFVKDPPAANVIPPHKAPGSMLFPDPRRHREFQLFPRTPLSHSLLLQAA